MYVEHLTLVQFSFYDNGHDNNNEENAWATRDLWSRKLIVRKGKRSAD